MLQIELGMPQEYFVYFKVFPVMSWSERTGMTVKFCFERLLKIVWKKRKAKAFRLAYAIFQP